MNHTGVLNSLLFISCKLKVQFLYIPHQDQDTISFGKQPVGSVGSFTCSAFVWLDITCLLSPSRKTQTTHIISCNYCLFDWFWSETETDLWSLNWTFLTLDLTQFNPINVTLLNLTTQTSTLTKRLRTEGLTTKPRIYHGLGAWLTTGWWDWLVLLCWRSCCSCCDWVPSTSVLAICFVLRLSVDLLHITSGRCKLLQLL